MPEAPPSSAAHKVVCPHCGKTFEPAPLQAESVRNAGFKCPHCRLFVALTRAEAPQSESP